MKITGIPLYVVTIPDFSEDEEIDDPVYATHLEGLMHTFLGMEQTGKHPAITAAHYTAYDDENEARAEALRRLRNQADAIQRKIAEMEFEQGEEEP